MVRKIAILGSLTEVQCCEKEIAPYNCEKEIAQTCKSAKTPN